MTKIARHGQLLSLSTFQHSGACLYANCIMLGIQRIRLPDYRGFTAILHWRQTAGLATLVGVVKWFSFMLYSTVRLWGVFSAARVKNEGVVRPRVFGSCSADGITTACCQIAGRNSHRLSTTYVHILRFS
jgi:hypothetical protein